MLQVPNSREPSIGPAPLGSGAPADQIGPARRRAPPPSHPAPQHRRDPPLTTCPVAPPGNLGPRSLRGRFLVEHEQRLSAVVGGLRQAHPFAGHPRSRRVTS